MCTIKNNLAILRCINGFNQKDVSDYLGISLQTYCNKEKGNRQFTLEEAKKISELFKLSIEDIFFNNEVFKMNTNVVQS